MSELEEKGNRRRAEQESVRTTIVGGRPPGAGKPLGDVPRGIEVLVKKAAVDPAFRQLLLDKRAEAAKAIGLELRPSEVAMLNGIPREQLETIISRTTVDAKLRPILMGAKVALMLAALGAGGLVCAGLLQTAGHGARRRTVEHQENNPTNQGTTSGVITPSAVPADTDAVTNPPPVTPRPDSPPVTRGVQPNRPPVTEGIRPDRPDMTQGMRPDRPPAADPAKKPAEPAPDNDAKPAQPPDEERRPVSMGMLADRP